MQGAVAREILTAVLCQRFGSLPDEVSIRIRTADLPTLRQWTAKLTGAMTLDQILD